MTDTHNYRKPSFTTDPSQIFRYIEPRPRVVLPLSTAGDRRVCAGPLDVPGGGLGLRTARGLGVRWAVTSPVWGRRTIIYSRTTATLGFLEIRR